MVVVSSPPADASVVVVNPTHVAVALLQERFAPVYFMHRFAINSLAKTIGGMQYSNAVRGDGQRGEQDLLLFHL